MKMQSDKNHFLNSQEHKQSQSDRMTIQMYNRVRDTGSIYSRANSGWYEISGVSYYFRSGWEVVYARYLEWLYIKKKIKKWEYEPDTFWFEKIKRGVRSYLPDFKVTNNNDSIEYHEVKGYMDSKSKTKLKRMEKYYPDIKMILIDKESYQSVKKFERLFPEAKSIKKPK